MSLATRLAKLRRDKKESLQQVADAIGVSKAHVWQLERDLADNPSLAVLKGLADHFGVPVGYLVNDPNESSKIDPQLSRMYRDMRELDPDDRDIIEDMIKSMKQRRKNAPAG